MDFSFEPFGGSATYVWMPPMVSMRPEGCACLWTEPLRQHAPIPTPVDMMYVIR